MAFMFETRAVIRPVKQALDAKELDRDYYECWQGIKKHFDPGKR
jgi:homogentisate 1,2-dioxygenase